MTVIKLLLRIAALLATFVIVTIILSHFVIPDDKRETPPEPINIQEKCFGVGEGANVCVKYWTIQKCKQDHGENAECGELP